METAIIFMVVSVFSFPAALPAAAATGSIAALIDTEDEAGSNYTGSFDPNRLGHITLIYRDTDGNALKGAAFRYARVAVFGSSATGSISESCISLIKKKDGSLYPISTSTDAAKLLPHVKRAYRKGRPEYGILFKAKTNASGIAETKDLPPGIYLAWEANAVDGYMSSRPFLFSMPQAEILSSAAAKIRQNAALWSENAADRSSAEAQQLIQGWNYHLTAEPKPRLKTISKNGPSGGSAPSVRTSLPAVKTGDAGQRADLYIALLVFSSFFLLSAVSQRVRRAVH